jgi:hypothetical protein
VADGQILFGRQYELVIETLKITPPLDITFEVVRTLRSRPNACTIRVYNLSEQHRGELEQAGTVRVSLRAGYREPTGMSQLFLGRLKDVTTTREGQDLVTEITGLDGGGQHQRGRANRSFAAGTPIGAAIERIAGDIAETAASGAESLGLGNVAETIRSWAPARRQLSQGLTVSGHGTEELERLTSAAGLEWSVQDERFQFLPRGRALPGTAVVLSERTGLIGVPAVDKRGRISCEALLIPDVFPGRRIRLESERLNTTFRAEKCTYAGDTHGTEWTIKIEGREEGRS